MNSLLVLFGLLLVLVLTAGIVAERRFNQVLAGRKQQSSELTRIGQEINSFQDPGEAMRALVTSALKLTGAQAGAAGIYRNGEMLFKEYLRSGEWLPIDLVFPPGTGVPGWIIQHPTPYLTNDTLHDPAVVPEIQKKYGFRNLLDIPILGQKAQLLGCFELHDKPGGFTEADVDLLQELAIFGAIALEHVRSLEEQKKIEQKTLESERRLQEIIEFLPDATYVIDGDGVVIAWNRAMEELSGISAGQMVGLGDYAYAIPMYGERRPMLSDLILHPELASSYPYQFVSQERETLVAEVFIPEYRAGGGYFWLKASPLYDAQGCIVGAIEGIRDITRRKREEEELKRLNEDLETRIAERTAKLAQTNTELQKETQERLRLQEEQINALEEADKTKDEFLSVISHELRTPLNSIMGFSSLLQDEVMGGLNQPQKEYVEKILASADRMLELINNLLDIARMRAGRFELFPTQADYAHLVQDTLSNLLPQVREKKLSLETDLDVPHPVTLDEQRITQVLTNLLSNAIKFTPEGGQIRVKAYLQGKELVTEVTDTGLGISEEDLGKLFSPFQQLDMSLTRKVGGSGLGLSISKGIVEAHGGHLTAESPGLGKGSTFRFTIPD